MAILGRRGSGKSATARGLVEGELRAGHRTCIIDPKGDWWGLRLDADGVSPAFDVPIFGGEHGDVALRPEMGESLGELIATHDLSCVVDLSAFSIKDMRRFMRAFAESLYENNRNPLTLVVDEADQLAPQSVPQEMATLLHRMDRLVRMGRKRGLWMWMITQRPAVLNKNLLTQVETLIAMQTTGKTDREAVAGWMEAHSHEGARSVMDTLAKLSVGEGWVWSAGADFLERIQFPMFRTYDSSRTPKHGEVVDAVRLPPIDIDAVKVFLDGPGIKPLEAIASNPPESMKDMPKASIGIRNADIAGFGSSDIRRLAERQELEKLRAKLVAMEKRALRAEELISGMLMAQRNFQNVWAEAGEMWGLVHAYAFGADRHLIENGWESPPSIVNDDKPCPELKSVSEIPGNSAGADGGSSIPEAAAVQIIPKPKPIPMASGDLTGPQAHLLGALAWWAAKGHESPTRAQVAAIAGWKITSGHLKNVAGALRTAGLISYPDAGRLALTEAGRERAPDAPSDLSLHDQVRAALTTPQAAVFDALLMNREMSRERIALSCGWNPKSGHLKNVLGSLRTLEIVTYPAQGYVALQEWLL